MTKEDIIKDCEKIIKEINFTKNELKIKFITTNDNDFTKKKQLIMQDKDNKIIVMKEYLGGPEDFSVKYKNSKFSKPVLIK